MPGEMNFEHETAWALAPYLGLRPTQIFPISLESAPFLFSVWFVLKTTIRIIFITVIPFSFGYFRVLPVPGLIVAESTTFGILVRPVVVFDYLVVCEYFFFILCALTSS